MKIALFSDLHAHPFKPYAKVLSDGMNSRLRDAINCIEQIVEECVINDVDLVLFGGDLFHVRRQINVMAFNAAYQALSKFRVHNIPVALIPGNHDMADKEGKDHSTYAFRTFCTVIDEPSWYLLQGRNGETCAVLGIPYTENVAHLQQVVQAPPPAAGVPKILLGHLGIQGAKVGADFVFSNPHDARIEDLQCSKFDQVFLGHYHLHQQLAPNAWYIGAPLQHNWGDRGQPRGFLIYDTETHSHEFVSLNAPEFVQVDPGGSAAGKAGDYVRLVDTRQWSEDERENYRQKIQAASLEIVPPKVQLRPSTAPRIEITPTMTLQESMTKYVMSGRHSTDGLDDSYLLQIGREILEEVGE